MKTCTYSLLFLAACLTGLYALADQPEDHPSYQQRPVCISIQRAYNANVKAGGSLGLARKLATAPPTRQNRLMLQMLLRDAHSAQGTVAAEIKTLARLEGCVITIPVATESTAD